METGWRKENRGKMKKNSNKRQRQGRGGVEEDGGKREMKR